MAFREKSAWVMGLVLLAGMIFYFRTVWIMSAEVGGVAPPLLPLVIVYVIAIVILSIIGHVLIALSKPSEADTPMDERDNIIAARAGSIGGFLMGLGVITSLGVYLFTYDGDLLFHSAFGSVMVAQLAEYVAQVTFYRTSL